MRAEHVRWDDIPPEAVYRGISRRTIIGQEATIVRYTYQPGSEFPTHSHPEEQITAVHSGEIEFDVGGRLMILRAGDVAVVPGNVPHGARVTGKDLVVADNFIASALRSPISIEPDANHNR